MWLYNRSLSFSNYTVKKGEVPRKNYPGSLSVLDDLHEPWVTDALFVWHDVALVVIEFEQTPFSIIFPSLWHRVTSP